ncbi:hypothetical protein JMJ77_0007220, partial [Colletotrichum scovillei]
LSASSPSRRPSGPSGISTSSFPSARAFFARVCPRGSFPRQGPGASPPRLPCIFLRPSGSVALTRTIRTIEMQLSSVASARFTLPCVSPSPPCPRQTMLRHSRTPKSMQFQFCPYKLRLFSGSQALPTSAMYIAPDGSRKTALARVAELPDVRMVSLQRGISFLERSPASSCA